MIDVEMRTDEDMRATVAEALRLFSSKGGSAAAAYLYRFGVPAEVIERVVESHTRVKTIRNSAIDPQVSIGLTDVIATEMLATRMPCWSLLESGKKISWQLPGASLDVLVESARMLLRADAVGISQFNMNKSELTWIDIAGDLQAFRGRRFPRRHSMCDVCYRTGQPQLFVQPHLYFEWMAANGLYVHEALITPLRGKDHAFVGTMWAVSTDNQNEIFTAAHLGLLKLYAAAIPNIHNFNFS